MNKLLFLLAYIFCFSSVLAQKEDYVWAFGKQGGLDFNNGSPVAIQTALGTTYDESEGSASVCDKNGQLLFYTDGSYIWDRNNSLMPTTSAITGLPTLGQGTGTESTTQAAVIVPAIGSTTQYYVFSLTQLEWGLGRLSYSIVDMNLRGGLGDVLPGKMGILLDTTLTEKMTAVAGDKCNVWLMVRSVVDSTYKAYSITPSGVNANPVSSQCGLFPALSYSAGVLKFSPDRKRMVATCNQWAFLGLGGLELYDFNPVTGVVSNPVIIDSGTTTATSTASTLYYGVCFSPDGSKLYGTTHNANTPGIDPGIYQFDLSGPVNSIKGSKYPVAINNLGGDLKVGPDGKIYVATGEDYLSIINAPNLSGNACQFVLKGIMLSMSTKSAGLPNVIAVVDGAHAAFDYKIIYGCTADTVKFTNSDSTISSLKYKWDFDDGSIDTNANTTHIFRKQGNYHVKFYVSNKGCIDTNIQAIDLQHPLQVSFTVNKDTICLHDTIVFNNTSIATNPFYYWRFADGIYDTGTNPKYVYKTPGLHKATLFVTDFIGCTDSASRFLVVDVPGNSDFEVDDIACAGTPMIFAATFSEAGHVSHVFDFGDGSIVKNGNPVPHAYLTAGTYYPTLTTKYRACPDNVSKDTVTVAPYPFVNIGPDTSLCPNQSPITLVNFIPQPAGNSNYWNTGATASQLMVDAPGTYWLSVVNKQGCATTDTIEIKKGCYTNIPNAFTPNGDGVNDYFFPRELLSHNVVRFHMQLFNRWGAVIFVTDNINGRGWDGTFNGVPQLEGTYVYVISVGYNNGVEEKYNGNVTLLR